MPVIFSKLLSKFNVNHSVGFSSVIIAAIFLNSFLKSRKLKSKNGLLSLSLNDAKTKTDDLRKAGINKQFFKSLLHFLKILIPHACTHEALLIILITSSIVARTICDVWLAHFTTKIESLIITRQKSAFYQGLWKFTLAAPSVALINNLLQFGIHRLKLRFRTRLSNHFYDKYLRNYTYYQLANFDNRIKNIDQLLTEDVDKFSKALVDLYSNVTKPILDLLIYIIKLYMSLGIGGPGYLLTYLIVSGAILTKIRKPLTSMTIKEQQFEGEYRFINSRLIANSEEIAFYQGNQREKKTIKMIFDGLRTHLENIIEFRFFTGIVDNLLAKYLATTTGLITISQIFFDPGTTSLSKLNHAETVHYYYSTGRMMVNMALAVGRIVLSGRSLASLAGFTARIQELDSLLNELNSSDKLIVNKSKEFHDAACIQLVEKKNVNLVDNVIKFEDVPIITPSGDMLIDKITFEVKSGCNVLICGPNGCGKSSIFRILSGLWPQFGGKITKPASCNLFYIPQKPYMTIGTLRDQIIYPDTYDSIKAKGFEDHHLLTIMEKVELEYIVSREGGWDSIRDWIEVLSGGEKQRVAMARLFFHKPQFAILDECTSAVSVDVEGTMYNYCREIGVTLFTVSHRKSLWKHHDYFLYMDGKGKYDFKPISEEVDIFGS